MEIKLNGTRLKFGINYTGYILGTCVVENKMTTA